MSHWKQVQTNTHISTHWIKRVRLDRRWSHQTIYLQMLCLNPNGPPKIALCLCDFYTYTYEIFRAGEIYTLPQYQNKQKTTSCYCYIWMCACVRVCMYVLYKWRKIACLLLFIWYTTYIYIYIHIYFILYAIYDHNILPITHFIHTHNYLLDIRLLFYINYTFSMRNMLSDEILAMRDLGRVGKTWVFCSSSGPLFAV